MTKHITPSAPRTLSEKPFVKDVDFTFRKLGEKDPNALTSEEARVLCQLEDDAKELIEADAVASAFAKLRRIAGLK